MRNKALTAEIARQAYADNPQAGSIDLNPALDYDIKESPAYGSDDWPPDYTDFGFTKSPAQGITDKPSPSGNYVVPKQLGRSRSELGALAHAQDAAGEGATAGDADRQLYGQMREQALHELATLKLQRLKGYDRQLDSEAAEARMDELMGMLGISHEWAQEQPPPDMPHPGEPKQ